MGNVSSFFIAIQSASEGSPSAKFDHLVGTMEDQWHILQQSQQK